MPKLRRSTFDWYCTCCRLQTLHRLHIRSSFKFTAYPNVRVFGLRTTRHKHDPHRNWLQFVAVDGQMFTSFPCRTEVRLTCRLQSEKHRSNYCNEGCEHICVLEETANVATTWLWTDVRTASLNTYTEQHNQSLFFLNKLFTILHIQILFICDISAIAWTFIWELFHQLWLDVEKIALTRLLRRVQTRDQATALPCHLKLNHQPDGESTVSLQTPSSPSSHSWPCRSRTTSSGFMVIHPKVLGVFQPIRQLSERRMLNLWTDNSSLHHSHPQKLH